MSDTRELKEILHAAGVNRLARCWDENYDQQLMWCYSQNHSRPQTIVDVGTGWGISATTWLWCTRGTDTTVLTVDVVPEGGYGGVNTIRRLPPDMQERCRCITGLGAEVVPFLRQAEFIYLDSSHLYHDTLAELEACWFNLQPGGVLTGHDAGDFIQVAFALDRWAETHGLSPAINTNDHTTGVFTVRKEAAL